MSRHKKMWFMRKEKNSMKGEFKQNTEGLKSDFW